jgi:hypothetical protein
MSFVLYQLSTQSQYLWYRYRYRCSQNFRKLLYNQNIRKLLYNKDIRKIPCNHNIEKILCNLNMRKIICNQNIGKLLYKCVTGGGGQGVTHPRGMRVGWHTLEGPPARLQRVNPSDRACAGPAWAVGLGILRRVWGVGGRCDTLAAGNRPRTLPGSLYVLAAPCTTTSGR